MRRVLFNVLLVGLITLFTGCGGGSSDGAGKPTVKPTEPEVRQVGPSANEIRTYLENINPLSDRYEITDLTHKSFLEEGDDVGRISVEATFKLTEDLHTTRSWQGNALDTYVRRFGIESADIRKYYSIIHKSEGLDGQWIAPTYANVPGTVPKNTLYQKLSDAGDTFTVTGDLMTKATVSGWELGGDLGLTQRRENPFFPGRTRSEIPGDRPVSFSSEAMSNLCELIKEEKGVQEQLRVELEEKRNQRIQQLREFFSRGKSLTGTFVHEARGGTYNKDRFTITFSGYSQKASRRRDGVEFEVEATVVWDTNDQRHYYQGEGPNTKITGRCGIVDVKQSLNRYNYRERDVVALITTMMYRNDNGRWVSPWKFGTVVFDGKNLLQEPYRPEGLYRHWEFGTK